MKRKHKQKAAGDGYHPIHFLFFSLRVYSLGSYQNEAEHKKHKPHSISVKIANPGAVFP